MRKEYINVNTNKLHDELIAAGIVPLLVESAEEKTWVTFADDVDLMAVKAVIDVHNPEPLSIEPTAEERIVELEAENLMNMMALVDLHMMILAIGGGE